MNESEYEEKIKYFLSIDENIRNKDIVKGAIEWIKTREPNFKNAEDINIQYMLFSIARMGYGNIGG